MASSVYENPRQLAVPVPYNAGTVKSISSTKGPDTIRALREKLSEYKNENTLLGNLVKDWKAERDSLIKKNTAASKQLADANSRAANASAEHQAASKEQQRLEREVERLSSVVHSHSVRLQKSKQRQQELEDVALDLRQELEDANTQLARAQQAEQQAQQRCTAAEAKLVAAGLGAMPKMGPTAEQLVINSTQRIRELTEELAAARAVAEQQQSAFQQQMQQQEQQWQQQLAAAQQQLQQRQQQHELELQRQGGRLSESEQQVQQLQHMLVGLQSNAAEGQAMAEAKIELQRLKQDMLSQTQKLQQQVLQLQTQLADAQLQHAETVSDQQQQNVQLERKLSTAKNEKQQLTAALIAVRQQESTHRIAVGEVTAKLERLRGQLVNCVGELQVQMDGAAAASQQHTETLQQLRTMEATAAAARAEAAETRQQLVELASVSIAELRSQVAGEAVAITGLPADTVGDLPMPVTTYIKVLEHAVCDCEQRCKQLLADTLDAQQHERKLRTDLSAAQEQQAATQRALTQQTQRLLAAERMRLSDLRETQGVEKRLLLAQQECWTLRDALLAAKSGTAAAAAIAGASTIDSVAASGSPAHLAAWRNNSSAQAGGSHDRAQQVQWPGSNQQEQEPVPRLWATTAADAAAAHSNTAADVAAGKHQTKLEQLRQLKQQFSSKLKVDGAIATAPHALQQQAEELQPMGKSASRNANSVHPSSSGPGGLTIRAQQQQQQEQHANDTAAAAAAAAAAGFSAGTCFSAIASASTSRAESVKQQQLSHTAATAAARNLDSATAKAEPDRLGSLQQPAAAARCTASFSSNGTNSTSCNRGALLKQASSKLTAAQGGSSTVSTFSSAGRDTAGQQTDILSPKELEHELSGGLDNVYSALTPAAAPGGSVAQPTPSTWLQQQEQPTRQWQPQQQHPSLGGWMHAPGKVAAEGEGAMGWQPLQAEVLALCPEPFDAGAWHR